MGVVKGGKKVKQSGNRLWGVGKVKAFRNETLVNLIDYQRQDRYGHLELGTGLESKDFFPLLL